MAAPRYPVLRVVVPEERLELTQLRLFELGATGLEQFDRSTIVRATDERIAIDATFENETQARVALSEMQREFEAALGFIADADWATEWRRGFGPQYIGARLLLQPSWDRVENPEGRAVITIDPENAFGSGDHETTRLVLRILERRVRGGETVLDVGCGSGILSIGALVLGAASAIGVDIEEAAVEVSRRNAQSNEVGGRFEVSQTPLEAIEGEFSIVVANIETRVLVHMPDALETRMEPSGFLALSGVLRDEEQSIREAFRRFQIVETLSENEWMAFVMERQ